MDKSQQIEVIAKRNPRVFSFFVSVFTRQLRKNFNSVRILNKPPSDIVGPLICFLNHPSWNDPMVVAFLHAKYFPDRESYAPIDAVALEGYGFMKKIGVFGVTHGNPGGARRFLRIGQAILDRPKTVLWITRQGKFADIRERPTTIEPGLGGLLKVTDKTVLVLPLAVEYTYGEEKCPEVFVSFGQPIESAKIMSADDWTVACENGLEAVQDELAEKVISKKRDDFEVILGGNVGVGGFFGVWQRLKAVFYGERYDPSHGTLTK